MDRDDNTRTGAELCAAFWFATYNKYRILCAGGTYLSDEALKRLDEDEQDFFHRFERYTLVSTPLVPWQHASLPDSVGIQDLNVRDHGEELVEWASDMLARNLIITWHQCHEPYTCCSREWEDSSRG